jgi:DNA repair protein RadD
LDEAVRLGADRKCWLVFASGVDHALHVTEALNDRGIPATCVHSKLKTAERDQRIADFKAGHYKAMVNNSILTTGFDHPPVDMEVILRPTRSTSLHVQILGRGTRPSPATGKENCLVLDFAGNTRRLGPINNPVLPRKKGQGGSQEAPCRVCDACQAYNLISAKVCAFCGEAFPVAVSIMNHASVAPLIAKVLPDEKTTSNVDRVVYSLHRKAGKPDSVRVTYYSGLNQYSEWVCPNHGGYARLKFEQWWAKRGGT